MCVCVCVCVCVYTHTHTHIACVRHEDMYLGTPVTKYTDPSSGRDILVYFFATGFFFVTPRCE